MYLRKDLLLRLFLQSLQLYYHRQFFILFEIFQTFLETFFEPFDMAEAPKLCYIPVETNMISVGNWIIFIIFNSVGSI